MTTICHPIRPSRLPALSAIAGAVLLLAACGGGGGDDATPTDASTVDLPTRVIDGAIGNALVCLDRNANALCDEGEPSGRSAADGTVTLKIAPDDAGKYPLLAMVGTDATDADHGPVTSPFVLRAPADATTAITPLSTLVASAAETSGQTTAQADGGLRQQLGFGGSLLGNPMQGSDATLALRARDLARVLVLAQQKAMEAFKSAEGRQDSAGATITRADVTRLAHQVLAANVQQLAAIAASDAARTDAALKASVDAFAADRIGAPSADMVVQTLEGFRMLVTSEPVADTTAASMSLRWFTYADAGNWYFRTFEATAEQNTPDANNGLRRFTEKRKRAQGGTVQTWGETAAYTRNDFYWTGSQWYQCPTTHVHAITPYAASAAAESLYCDTYKGLSRRVPKDIGGRLMSEVVAEIRAFPSADTEGDLATWGPSPDDPLIANKVFPAGATLWTFSSTESTSAPDGYNPVDVVVAYVPAVASGGSSAAGSECSKVTNDNFATFHVRPATLEEMAAGYPGTPCVYNPAAGRNEWWSNSTISIGTVDAPQSDPTYTNQRSIRVAFAGGKVANFYSCLLLASSGSARNCDPIGTGTYAIEVLGDARVLRFSRMPAAAAPLTYTRLFVERGGSVFYGYHSKPRSVVSLRPDMTATDALFGALGITR